MFKNYFKIAFRNLAKSKVYSFINIGGLAIGMAVAMLIGLWIYAHCFCAGCLPANEIDSNYKPWL